ncbi:MAG: DUF192 domain-containing protein [Arhodomonas sp.]|nr:DUF192 domain-containing protein [Arhodomonas sp.]
MTRRLRTGRGRPLRILRQAPRFAFPLLLAVAVLAFAPLGPADDRGPLARALAVVEGMEAATVSVPGREDPLVVRIADDARERAQGMQHLPPAEIRARPIWFAYPSPRVTRWHMRNVRLPLDIVWMDVDGREPGGWPYGARWPRL